MPLFLCDTNLVLEGVVAGDTARFIFSPRLLLALPGRELLGSFFVGRFRPGHFALGSFSLPLSPFRNAGLPGAGLFLVKSCSVITVLAFLRLCAVASHFFPLVLTHFFFA